MAARGRERAQFYAWDRVSQQVLSYYERLMYERRIVERGVAMALGAGAAALTVEAHT